MAISESLRLARDIVRSIQNRTNLNTPYAVARRFSLPVEKARAILDLESSMLGPGGKGEEAYFKAAERVIKNDKTLTVPEQHQLKIARQTLRMPAAMAGVMGGPSRAEAVRVAEKLSGESRPFARLVIERGKSQSGERGWTVAEMLPEGGTYVPHFRFWGPTLHEARAAAHKMSGTEEGTFIEGSAASEYRPYSPDDSPFPRPAMPPGTRRG